MFCYSRTRGISSDNDTSCVSWKQSLLKALELMEQNICFEKGTEKLRNCLDAMRISLMFTLSTFSIHYEQNTCKCQFTIYRGSVRMDFSTSGRILYFIMIIFVQYYSSRYFI